jgi:DNA-binding MarR family transcriptional regulator
MAELEKCEPVSQREIAGRLGLAVGLVNSYLKTLVKKGLVQVSSYPRNRYAYLLTPSGLAEKSRLAYRHLSNYHKLYRLTRQESLELFRALQSRGVERVAFCGVDDLTEIAYLSLCEAGLALEVVMDEEGGGRFLGKLVVSLAEGVRAAPRDPIVLTCLPRAARLQAALREFGVPHEEIHSPSTSYEEALRHGAR